MTKLKDMDQIIVDDGQMYIALKASQHPRGAQGYLRRRCAHSANTPYGYDCMGQFKQEPSGAWTAIIDVQSELWVGREDLVVAREAERIEAICALWLARGNAWSRYS